MKPLIYVFTLAALITQSQKDCLNQFNMCIKAPKTMEKSSVNCFRNQIICSNKRLKQIKKHLNSNKKEIK